MGKLLLIGQVLTAVEINFFSSFLGGDRKWPVPSSKFLMIYKPSNRSLLKKPFFFCRV